MIIFLLSLSNSIRAKGLFIFLVTTIFLATLALTNNLALADQAIKAPLASRSLLLDGVSVDELTVVVGERGHILISEDNGQSWHQVEVPSSATLTGAYFHNKQLGWVVGHDHVILRTRDGGANWQRVYYNPEADSPLLDIWFKDAKKGFAIGAYGAFLETRDGGESWDQRTLQLSNYADEDFADVDYHLNHIAVSSSGRIYIAAEAGNIYRSDDDGQSWKILPSPYHGSFFGTLPLGEETLLLFGLRGHMFRSEDAGETWQSLKTSTQAMLTSAAKLKDGTIIVTGLGGTILTSVNGGKSFTLKQRSDRKGISAILELRDGSLMLIGEFGIKQLQVASLSEG